MQEELICRQGAINAVLTVCEDCNPIEHTNCVGCKIDEVLAKLEELRPHGIWDSGESTIINHGQLQERLSGIIQEYCEGEE